MQLDELPPLDGVPERARHMLRSLDTEAGTRRLRSLIAALLLVGVVVVIGRGGSRPRDPYLVDQSAGEATATSAPSAATPGRDPGAFPGMPSAVLTVTSPGATRTLCAVVAETEAQRQQGLMGRQDLGGFDAMVFRFPQDSTSSFYMRNTPLPLSIAWYDGSGAFVSAADMDPCPDRDDCPTYPAAKPYRLAVEVRRGALAAARLVPGSTVALGGACR